MPLFLMRIRFMKGLVLIAFIALVTATLLSGCSNKEFNIEDAVDNVSALYIKTKDNADAGRFELAMRYFDELETRYPFSPYALQARLDLAYTFVLYGIPEQAVSEADKFIRFNPTHKHVDYAYYIRGVANFGQKKQLMGSWFPKDPANFEQSPLVDAFNDFSFLVRNFPESKYAEDAHKRLIFLRNTFARHELHVAKYYTRKKAWVAAANRANFILQNYEDTPVNAEALAILYQSYRALELEEAANNVEKILSLNFPDHPALTIINE